MQYADVVGQTTMVRDICETIHADNWPHAVLIQGLNGYGGLIAALVAAKHLVCQKKLPDGPCGQCTSCMQMEKLIHADVHFCYPVVKKEGKTRKDTTSVDYLVEWREAVLENPYLSLNTWLRRISSGSARGDINVTECNRIVQNLGMKSFSGGNKVQIIWMSEYLGKNGNKLLKLIEEPPPNTYLILLCEDIDQVLGTIQSRCRIMRFSRIGKTQMFEFLRERGARSEDDLNQLVNLSDGDLNRALQSLEMTYGEMFPLAIKWLDVCVAKDLIGIREWVETIDTLNIEEKKAVLVYLLQFTRQLMTLSFNPASRSDLSDLDKERIKKRPFLSNLDLDQYSQLVHLVSDSIGRLERNVNSKIMFFNSSLKIHRVLRKKKAASLV